AQLAPQVHDLLEKQIDLLLKVLQPAFLLRTGTSYGASTAAAHATHHSTTTAAAHATHHSTTTAAPAAHHRPAGGLTSGTGPGIRHSAGRRTRSADTTRRPAWLLLPPSAGRLQAIQGLPESLFRRLH